MSEDKKWSGERAVERRSRRLVGNGKTSEQAHRESAEQIRNHERRQQDKKGK